MNDPTVLRGKIALFPLVVTEDSCRAMLIGRFDNPTSQAARAISDTFGAKSDPNHGANGNSGVPGDLYVARGPHSGLVVSKKIALKDSDLTVNPDITLQFKVFLATQAPSASPGTRDLTSYTQERRVLKFWFDSSIVSEASMWTEANTFFTQLLSPKDFPRDYVGFITKVMKMMQKSSKIELVELRLSLIPETKESDAKPTSKSAKEIDADLDLHMTRSIMEWIESAYPNSISTDYITESILTNIRTFEAWASLDESRISYQKLPHILQQLKETAKIVQLRDGTWIRVTCDDLLKSPPNFGPKPEEGNQTPCLLRHRLNRESTSSTLSSYYDSLGRTGLKYASRPNSSSSSNFDAYAKPNAPATEQPTVAIITSQFCEKLAVDAMISGASTFIKYKSHGDNHVYTLGNIGTHRVVSTKIPLLGNSRQAMTSAGNSITRMLGTFQAVKYVFLVGAGMGVDHFVEYKKPFRLGDVIVSTRTPGCDYIYVRCEETKCPKPGNHPNGTVAFPLTDPSASCTDPDPEEYIRSGFEIKTWRPKSLELEHIIDNLVCQYIKNPKECPWREPLQEGSQRLIDQDTDFSKPFTTNDKLPICVGNGDVIQIDSSPPKRANDGRDPQVPAVHLGAIGSCNFIASDPKPYGRNGSPTSVPPPCHNGDLRPALSQRYGLLAFDNGFDPIIESVEGNCVENYIIIRGIAHHYYPTSLMGQGENPNLWSPYASLAAASVMKAIITEIPPAS